MADPSLSRTLIATVVVSATDGNVHALAKGQAVQYSDPDVPHSYTELDECGGQIVLAGTVLETNSCPRWSY